MLKSTGTETVELQITYPPEYPDVPVQFSVSWPSRSRSDTELLRQELLEIATAAQGDVVVLQLYQRVLDAITDQRSMPAEDQQTLDSACQQELLQPPSAPVVVLGRRAIYFHHIINENKRRVVKDWALELQLGGFSKIGWPGIVIVEGAESDCQEYVRRLQHLRWRQMVVRGEQTQQGETMDAMRTMPKGFQEFPTNGMSSLAAACGAAGVTELFLTTMKIYKEQAEASDQQSNLSSNSKPARGKRK